MKELVFAMDQRIYSVEKYFGLLPPETDARPLQTFHMELFMEIVNSHKLVHHYL